MSDRNGYSINNALAAIVTVTGLTTVAAGAIVAVQVTRTWSATQSNLAIVTCGLSTVAIAALAAFVFFSYALIRMRLQQGQQEWSPPPPGFGPRILPTTPPHLLPDPYAEHAQPYGAMPNIQFDDAGSFDAAPIEYDLS